MTSFSSCKRVRKWQGARSVFDEARAAEADDARAAEAADILCFNKRLTFCVSIAPSPR